MATATDGTRAPDEQPPAAADIRSLPFVRDLDRPRPGAATARCFWWPYAASGLDFTEGCRLGEDYALAAVRHMLADDLNPLLGWSMLEMAAPRTDGERGLVVAFASVFAHLACAHAAAVGMDRIDRHFAERRAATARLMAEDEARG